MAIPPIWPVMLLVTQIKLIEVLNMTGVLRSDFPEALSCNRLMLAVNFCI